MQRSPPPWRAVRGSTYDENQTAGHVAWQARIRLMRDARPEPGVAVSPEATPTPYTPIGPDGEDVSTRHLPGRTVCVALQTW